MSGPAMTDTESGLPPEVELPESLQSLAQDLNGPGPALPLSQSDADQLIAGALRQRADRKGVIGLGGGLRKGRAFGVAALLLLGSSAAAAWYQHRIDVQETERAQQAADEARAAPRRHPQNQQPRVPLSEPAAASAVTELQQPDQPEQTARTAAPEASSSGSPAEDLLQKANRLRREGQPKEAEQTYLQLVQREPQSMSAYVARVAVAELRLGRNPSSAIDLLQTALQRFPKGPLEIEIHQALAQAYRSTGNAALERSELTRLVTQYEGTPAADRARARLIELGN